MQNLVLRHIPAAAGTHGSRGMPMAAVFPDETAVICTLTIRRAKLTAALLNIAGSATAIG